MLFKVSNLRACKEWSKERKRLGQIERTIAGALAEETRESTTYVESYVKESIPSEEWAEFSPEQRADQLAKP